MATEGSSRDRLLGSLTLAGGLLLLTAAITLFGIISIVNARRAALVDAIKDLELDTLARARAIEADLAGCRADLLFLAGTPPLAGIPQALRRSDPFRVRWSRLDAQGSLLLFLGSHPEVGRLVIRDGSGTPLLVAARQEGAPQMYSPSTAAGPSGKESSASPPDRRPALSGRWPLAGGEGTLEAEVEAGALVAGALPLDPQFTLRDADGRELLGAAPEGAGKIRVEAPIQDDGWDPPVRWSLARAVDEERLISSVSRLATGVRMNLLFNLAVMALALVLGAVGLRQAQRTARLEAQALQQVQVRELERQLFHSERLSTVGRLAAGLAHEVNNPLEGMTNYLKLMEDDLAQGRLQEAQASLPRLQEGLRRAAGIVRQVLQFSNPASAPMDSIDLVAVLRESVDFVRGNREFRDVEIVTDLPEGLPAVSGNRLLLEQLFLNLILNACQAQPGGGTVEVTAGSEGDGVLARVADRGPGVPEEERERIFEPFFSSRHSTGLGLSVCRRIAEQHGAALRLSGHPGGGAEFSILLRKA
jgi:signal transduction histidine kinase